MIRTILTSVVWGLSTLCAMLFALFSCSKEQSSPMPVLRDVAVMLVEPNHALQGHAPFGIRLGVIAFPGSKDTNKWPFALKIELNYGDGSGWVDSTNYMLAWQNEELADSELPQHMYLIPGQYQPLARVTYWDGSIVERQSLWTITVLPPEDGGS
ncbi:MAG: hypothetical protein HRF49_01760 [bacterium]|jgi:hypothetical protein